jgi:hypothetical protein
VLAVMTAAVLLERAAFTCRVDIRKSEVSLMACPNQAYRQNDENYEIL